MFTLDLDILLLSTLHDIKNSMEASDNIFELQNTQKNEDINELYIAFPVKNPSIVLKKKTQRDIKLLHQ